MDRRGFLQAILASGVAPAFIGSGILMPVRPIFTFTQDQWIAFVGAGMLSAEDIVKQTVYHGMKDMVRPIGKARHSVMGDKVQSLVKVRWYY